MNPHRVFFTLVALIPLIASTQRAHAVSISAGAFGTFYSGVDATFNPFSSPPGLGTTDSHNTRQTWLGSFSGTPTVTTQNFDSGFVYGAVDPTLANAPMSQTVAGLTYSFSFFTGNQTGVFRGASGNPLDLDPVSGPDSTRGFNVEEGNYAGSNRGYLQIKPNSTALNNSSLIVDFGGTGVESFGFYLTGRETSKQSVNLVIEYANSNIDTLIPTAAGNLGVGGLGFVGYIGDGTEIAGFRLEEIFSGAGEDIFAIDGLETLTVVPEPSTWSFVTSLLTLSALLIRRQRGRHSARP